MKCISCRIWGDQPSRSEIKCICGETVISTFLPYPYKCPKHGDLIWSRRLATFIPIPDREDFIEVSIRAPINDDDIHNIGDVVDGYVYIGGWSYIPIQ